MPASRAAIGTRLWPVMPGDVFTSRNEYVPSGRSIRSSAAPAACSRRTWKAASDSARISSSSGAGRPRRAVVLRVVGEVLVLVVVVALRRLDADQRQRPCRRAIAAVSSCPSTNSSTSTSASCRAAAAPGLRELLVVDGGDLGDADRRALARGLDDQRQPELGDHAHPVGLRVDDAVARRRDAARQPHELGAPLVHRQRRRHHAAAGVGNAQRLERALHGAVLAEKERGLSDKDLMAKPVTPNIEFPPNILKASLPLTILNVPLTCKVAGYAPYRRIRRPNPHTPARAHI